MAEVASAYVSILPSARGFGGKLDSQISRDIDASGKKAGSRFGSAMKVGALGAAAAVGIGAAKILGDAISLEAEFSQTINTVGAVANVTGKRLEKLSDLALQMGKDTSFSAGEASDAMLELAKGGMTAATIQAGGLAGTLQLAAAGGTDMGTAATIASNAMNAFSLKGKDMSSVAAALAGGANASSASIESLGEALSQVGPGAVNAGLSLNETVAALAAFDSAGIKGSDAGTSLKTMLARLIPQTNKASKAMEQLGLDFVKGDGSFESVTNIAGQLQKRLGGLTEAQRSQALTTIFGSDASRAAAVLMQEGATGIRGFIKATQDQDAAQRAADARMKGTAGAIEQFKGSIETAKIQLGLMLGPAIQAGLRFLTAAVNGLGPAAARVIAFFRNFQSAERSAGQMRVLGQAVNSLRSIFQSTVTIVTALWKRFGPTLIRYTRGSLTNILQVVRGVLQVVAGVFKTVAALIQGDWRGAWDGIKTIVSGAKNIIVGSVKQLWNLMRTAFSVGSGLVRAIMNRLWEGIKKGAAALPGVMYQAGKDLVLGLINGIKSMAGAAADAAVAVVKGAIDKAKGALKIGSPSKVFHEIGAWTGEGFVNGMDAKTSAVRESGRKVAESVLQGWKDRAAELRDGVVQTGKDVAASVSQALTPSGLFSSMGEMGVSALDQFRESIAKWRTDLTSAQGAIQSLLSQGVGGQFLQQLAASGNTALLVELAGSGQALQFQSEFSALTSQASSIGSRVGDVAMDEGFASVVSELQVLGDRIVAAENAAALTFGVVVGSGAAKGHRDRKNRGKK